jgi:hypothetical protein
MLQVTSDMDSDEYAQGGNMELYISAGLGTPLGCFFLVFTILNLFGELLGSFGRMFIFEMDAVMGGLLGIPHYSKIEALMVGCGSAGAFLLWSRNPVCQLFSILGLLVVDLYVLICLSYGINARQPLGPFIVPLVPITAIVIWRCISFLNPAYYNIVAFVAVVGFILFIICHFIMRSRRAKCEPQIQKLITIQKFQDDQKSANPEWKMEWLRGKNAPEGYEESKIK